MAAEDYTPGLFSYPIEDVDHCNGKIQFEIVESLPPEFKVNFNSIPAKYSSFLGGPRSRATENTAASEDLVVSPELRSKNSVNVKSADVRGTGRKVNLYLPQSNAITDAFSYDTPALDRGGAALASALEGGMGVADAAYAAASEAVGGVDALVKAFGGTTQSFGRAAAVRAIEAAPVSGSVKAAVGITARASLHPNIRTRFNNVGIRQFSFTFNMIPRSAQEAQEIKDIVRFFRYHAYPLEDRAQLGDAGITVPLTYRYPDMFRIKMFTKVNGNFIRSQHKLLDCYCNSITTNYNPNVAVYHADGEPVQTNLTLNFMEHRALSRQDEQVEAPSKFYTPAQKVQEESGSF